ncbi:hypothetical protein [Bilophila sp.]|uniref:hypothetical protein n=1 Tax=Bilophila sp. TaxID=1929485 RepID=UPI00266E993D|nr:hypothetical protein [uncultured Bilophila sp.]
MSAVGAGRTGKMFGRFRPRRSRSGTALGGNGAERGSGERFPVGAAPPHPRRAASETACGPEAAR